MSYIKRAWLSVIRKPIKTLILFLIIFVLGNIMAGSVSIKKSLDNTEEAINKGLKPIVTLDIDYEKLNKEKDFDWNKIKYITESQINKIGKLSSVKYFDYNQISSMISNSLKRVTLSDDDQRVGVSLYDDNTYIDLYGVNYNKVMPIEEGKLKLSSGRTFTEEEINTGKNVIIVGKKFAELNNLSIGSKIKLYLDVISYDNNVMPYDTKEVLPTPSLGRIERELEVIGIFETTEVLNKNDQSSIYRLEEEENRTYVANKMNTNIQNEVNTILANNGKETYNNDYFIPLFVLNDAKAEKDFTEEAKAFLPEYYKIIGKDASFEAVKGPMKTINNVSNIILYASVGATVLILSLLTTLFLRDRKHELGIYMAMGEKKTKVVSQVVIEVLVVAFAAITMSLITGNIISNNISKSMLEAQFEKSDTNQTFYGNNNDYNKEITKEDVMENYKMGLDASSIALFYAISLGTVLISTIIPTTYIVRLKPKKILM